LRESLYLYNKLTGVRDDGWTGSCHHSASLCGQYFWTIDVDGSVYGMCDAFMAEDVVTEFRLGNVLECDLQDIKNTDAFAVLTERQYGLKHSQTCRDCSVYGYCKGGCPAFKSERNMLRSFSGDSVYCAYTRAFFGHLLDPARRQRIVAACRSLRPGTSAANR
jgi:radical SAM protein with 4Fe4S-binding SPASM domain